MDMQDTHPIDIRQLLRDRRSREQKLAAMLAPADWQSELRGSLAAGRKPMPMVSMTDVKLFGQSFAIFFVALMVFLI